MKKAMLKVLSLAMALTLVASLAACGGNSEEETTTGADTSTEAVVTPDETLAEGETVAEETTVIVTDAEGHTQVVTKAPSNDKTTAKAPAGGNNNQPTQAPGKPADATQEALNLFNNATVGVKKAGKRYTDVKVNLGGNLAPLGKIITPLLPNPNKPDDIPANEGIPNVKLTKTDVSSATAVKSGNNTVVTINVKPGASANAHAFKELPQDMIDDWLKNKLTVTPQNSIQFNYQAGKIVATISPDGKLVSGEYTMKVNVDVNNAHVEKGIFKMDVKEAHVKVTQTDKF